MDAQELHETQIHHRMTELVTDVVLGSVIGEGHHSWVPTSTLGLLIK
jgi:hypothetical protein